MDCKGRYGFRSSIVLRLICFHGLPGLTIHSRRPNRKLGPRVPLLTLGPFTCARKVNIQSSNQLGTHTMDPISLNSLLSFCQESPASALV